MLEYFSCALRQLCRLYMASLPGAGASMSGVYGLGPDSGKAFHSFSLAARGIVAPSHCPAVFPAVQLSALTTVHVWTGCLH